jgi:hypothetical protein
VREAQPDYVIGREDGAERAVQAECLVEHVPRRLAGGKALSDQGADTVGPVGGEGGFGMVVSPGPGVEAAGTGFSGWPP